jgi:chromosome segregation ATPase
MANDEAGEQMNRRLILRTAILDLRRAELALEYVKETQEAAEAEEKLKRREEELKRREKELKRREEELKRKEEELKEVQLLLEATFEHNNELAHMIELLAAAVLDRPADSVKCAAIAQRTGAQCKCYPMPNGYCFKHQALVRKSE